MARKEKGLLRPSPPSCGLSALKGDGRQASIQACPGHPMNTISVDARIALLRQALPTVPNSTKVLLRLAEALMEKGEMEEAADVFRRAYIQEPFPWLGRPGTDPESLRNEAAALIESGAIFSATIGALAIAEAHLGRVEEVRRLVDYGLFFEDTFLELEDGVDIDVFNAALASEVRTNLQYYDEPKGRAIRNAWRDNDVMRSDRPACRIFAAAIRRAAARDIAGLPASSDHPFLKSRPTEFEIEGWANLSDGAGYHKSHIHSRAWASGVYYVVEPAVAREPGSRRGWLHIGPPVDRDVSVEQGW